MSRATVRAAIGAALTGVGFTAVYTYAPTTLGGASKVLAIYSKQSRPDIISAGITNRFFEYFLDVYIKRESGVNTEDQLDAMQELIVTFVKANPSTANWSHLELGQSRPFFVEVEGIPYRVEQHPLLVKVTEG